MIEIEIGSCLELVFGLFASDKNNPQIHTKPREDNQVCFVYFRGSFYLEGGNLKTRQHPRETTIAQ